MKALNFRYDIPLHSLDNFEDYYILVSDFISMQDVTESCYYPELVGEPLRPQLNTKFPLDFVLELIVFVERMFSVAVVEFGVVRKNM